MTSKEKATDMTPKEKANEIGNKFYNGSVFDYDKAGHIREVARAKECATICVKEIMIQKPTKPKKYVNNFAYWEDVLREIELL